MTDKLAQTSKNSINETENTDYFIDVVKETVNAMKDSAIKQLIFGAVKEAVQLHVEKNWGHICRIAVFGSYADGGEAELHILARKIASQGFMAISGFGFYLPNDPNLHEAIELYPPFTRGLLESPFFGLYLYRHIMPEIIAGATNNLSTLRTNLFELEGCMELSKPVLGYIISPHITEFKSTCANLVVIGDHRVMECRSSINEPCPKRVENRPVCPFNDIVDLPLVIKNQFAFEDTWVLIALDNINSIDCSLKNFLSKIKC
jgi:hypothetical protein